MADFGTLYDHHVDEIFRYLARRVGPDVAEDLTAETFTEAWAHRERYDPDRGSPGAWLQGIAANLHRHHRRSEGRRHHAYDRLAGHRALVVEAVHDDLVAERVSARDDLPVLRQALDELSGGERDALALHADGERSYRGVAEALGISVGTVRSRLNRSRARLATRLGRPGP